MMPPNTAWVGKGSIFEPCECGKGGQCRPHSDIAAGIDSTLRSLDGYFVNRLPECYSDHLIEETSKASRNTTEGVRFLRAIVIRDILAGQNVACSCPADQTCYAGVLLVFANEPTGGKA